MRTLKYVLLLLAALTFCFHNCEKEESGNPLDPNSNISPDEWSPESLKVEQIDLSRVKLSWKQEIRKIDGFKIDRKLENNPWQVAYAIIDKNSRTWIDTSVILDSTITYRLYAYAGERESSSLEISITAKFPAPSNLSAKLTEDHRIQLIWKDNCNFEAGYIIERRKYSEDTFSQIALLDSNTTSYIDKDELIYGQIYVYRVRAFKSTVKSDYSPPLESGIGIFNKTFGGSTNDYGFDLQQTTDGGFIIIGSTTSFGAGGLDVWLIKVNAYGEKEWDKTMGGGNYDEAYSIQQTADEGFTFAGYTKSYGAGKKDIWLIKTDEQGNKIWDTTFGGENEDVAYSLQQTSDGGFILAGYTKSYGAGKKDIWLIKTDEQGNKIWDATFGGENEDVAYSLQQTSDGGFILAGYTKSYGAGGKDVWLIKTDDQGNKIWDATFGGENEDAAYSLQQTSDGGFVVAGYTKSYGSVDGDIWVIKTDVFGSKDWDITFHDYYDEARSIYQTSDGGYIIFGTEYDFPYEHFLGVMIKIDPAGNEEWKSLFEDYSFVNGRSIQQTKDGGFIAVGYKNKVYYDFIGITGFNEVWIMKTDSLGNTIEPSP